MIKHFSAPHDPKLTHYIEQTFHPEDDVLKAIRQAGEAEGLPLIQVGTLDALHLEVITRAVNAKKAVEIGTLFGYSGVCIARGLPDNGKLYTFEADSKHVRIAKSSFQNAKVDHKIEIFTGPAINNLPKISSHGPFDLVFIDADKENYPNYLNWAGENLKIGGIVLGDNTLAFGMIADEEFENPENRATVQALRLFNNQAANGGRFRATLLPTGEGLTMAIKLR